MYLRDSIKFNINFIIKLFCGVEVWSNLVRLLFHLLLLLWIDRYKENVLSGT